MALCRKLRRLEARANRLALRQCNGPALTEDAHNTAQDAILADVLALLGSRPNTRIFINTDPRGYAIKIESEDARTLDITRDLGGYGIIAPDLTVE